MGIPELERACMGLKQHSPQQWKSETARLGLVIADVEAAIAKGVSIQAVLSELQAAGLRLTFEGFQSARKRLRKKRGALPGRSVAPDYPAPETASESEGQKQAGEPDAKAMMKKLGNTGYFKDRGKK